MKFRHLFFVWGSAIGCWLVSLNSVRAQGTAFTYQGSLASNGAPANGVYSMQFLLLNSANTQVGSALTNAPVGVTNGLFTTLLDFGNQFVNNQTLYLQIGVRPNGSSNAFTILSPAQLLTPVPYAEDAYVAASYTGLINDTQLSTNIPELDASETFGGTVNFLHATGAFNGSVTGTLNASGTFSGSSSGTFTGTLIGNGAGVTNVNITNIVGIVQSNPNWQLIQAGTQSAVSGNNYLTTNATLSTLTLPASPNVGSTVYISGSGASGWALAQNAGQSIITGPLGLQGGLLWTAANNGSLAYRTVAASANGLQLVAGVSGGTIYYSANGGQTWAASDAPNKYWTGLASSADGSHMVAVQNSGYIYTSVNGGTNWVEQSGSTSTSYRCVASSADGLKLAAAQGYTSSGYIYTSTNGGTNWTATINGQNWSGICSSATGNFLAACSSNQNSQIYISYNSGVNWTNLGTANQYSGIACSADGTHLAAITPVTTGGGIYVSDDAGYSWTLRAFAQTWMGITCSSNGAYYAAVDYNGGYGYVYTSGNYGQTWTQRTNGYTAGQPWTAITSSADGTRILAAASIGLLYDAVATTTVGTNGGLSGPQYSSLQLQYVGNGQWMPLNFTGSFSEY